MPQCYLELWGCLAEALNASAHWKGWKIKIQGVKSELLDSNLNSDTELKWIVMCLIDVSYYVITCTKIHNLILNPLKSFLYFY